MKKNVGGVDKLIRYGIALVIAVLYYLGIISGTLGLVLLIFAIVLILTGFFGFCGLYTLFGVNTCKVRERKQR